MCHSDAEAVCDAVLYCLRIPGSSPGVLTEASGRESGVAKSFVLTNAHF